MTIGTDTLFSDDFNRADGGLGSNYVDVVSGLAISGNQVVDSLSVGARARLADNSNFANANYSIQVDAPVGEDTGSVTIGFRAADNNNYDYITVYVNYSDGFYLEYRRVVGGSDSLVSQVYLADEVSLTGTTWRVDVDGTSFSVYLDGSLLWSHATLRSNIGYPVIGLNPISLSAGFEGSLDNLVIKGTQASGSGDVEAVGSAAGAGSAAGVGASTAESTGASSGDASVSGQGASTAAATGSSGGAGGASAVGQAVIAATGSSAGSADTAAAGASTAAAQGSAAAAGSVSGAGAATAESAGTASGTSSASAVGAATAAGVGTSSGTATASAQSDEGGASGTAAGGATVAGVGASEGAAAGASSGAASAAATGAASVAAAGTAVASSSASAVGSSESAASAIGTSAGGASASGVGQATVASSGTAAGGATASGVAAIPVSAPTRTVSRRTVKSPAIRRGNLDHSVKDLTEAVEIITGRRGDPLDAAPTWRDLLTTGVVAKRGKTGAAVFQFPSHPGFVTTGGTGALNLDSPPAPRDLTASAGLTQIQLQWGATPVGYTNPAYTEVWRNGVDDLGSAVRIATVNYPIRVWSDPVGSTGTTEFYWIRYVSQANKAGSFNAIHGVEATTGSIGSDDLTDLIVTANMIADGAINAYAKFGVGIRPPGLGDALPTLPDDHYPVGSLFVLTTDQKMYRVDATGNEWTKSVDGADVLAGTVAAGQVVAGGLAVNTIVAGDGAIANLAITRELVGDAEIDDAKIANVSVSKLTAGIVTAADVYIGDNHMVLDGSSGNLRVNDGARDRVKLGAITGGYGIEIRDDDGNIILSSGGTYSSDIANSAVTLFGLGYSGALDATRNTITSGSGVPSGGSDGDLYFRTSDSAWYSKIAGTWTQVSDITAANTAAAITGQGGLATVDAADWATQVTGSGKPADGATANHVTTGSGIPTGGADGDLYFDTSSSGWYSKISGSWTQVSDVTAANIAAGIAGQGALATQDQADWSIDISSIPANLSALSGSEGIINSLISLAESAGTISLSGAGSGSVTTITASNPLTAANISTYMSGAAIGVAEIDYAAINLAAVITVVADNVTAGTITGSTLQTASSGQRFVVSTSTNDARFYGDRGDGTTTLLAAISLNATGNNEISSFGSEASGFSRIGLVAQSYSNLGLFAGSVSSDALQANSTSGYGIVGIGGMAGGFFSSIGDYGNIVLEPATSSTLPTGRTGAMVIIDTGVANANNGLWLFFRTTAGGTPAWHKIA